MRMASLISSDLQLYCFYSEEGLLKNETIEISFPTHYCNFVKPYKKNRRLLCLQLSDGLEEISDSTYFRGKVPPRNIPTWK